MQKNIPSSAISIMQPMYECKKNTKLYLNIFIFFVSIIRLLPHVLILTSGGEIWDCPSHFMNFQRFMAHMPYSCHSMTFLSEILGIFWLKLCPFEFSLYLWFYLGGAIVISLSIIIFLNAFLIEQESVQIKDFILLGTIAIFSLYPSYHLSINYGTVPFFLSSCIFYLIMLLLSHKAIFLNAFLIGALSVLCFEARFNMLLMVPLCFFILMIYAFSKAKEDKLKLLGCFFLGCLISLLICIALRYHFSWSYNTPIENLKNEIDETVTENSYALSHLIKKFYKLVFKTGIKSFIVAYMILLFWRGFYKDKEKLTNKMYFAIILVAVSYLLNTIFRELKDCSSNHNLLKLYFAWILYPMIILGIWKFIRYIKSKSFHHSTNQFLQWFFMLGTPLCFAAGSMVPELTIILYSGILSSFVVYSYFKINANTKHCWIFAFLLLIANSLTAYYSEFSNLHKIIKSPESTLLQGTYFTDKHFYEGYLRASSLLKPYIKKNDTTLELLPTGKTRILPVTVSLGGISFVPFWGKIKKSELQGFPQHILVWNQKNSIFSNYEPNDYYSDDPLLENIEKYYLDSGKYKRVVEQDDFSFYTLM